MNLNQHLSRNSHDTPYACGSVRLCLFLSVLTNHVTICKHLQGTKHVIASDYQRMLDCNVGNIILHGHSVKRVVHCNLTQTRPWRRRDETRSGFSQDQLCFVHIFLILDMLYNCYQKGDFSQRACDEEMSNHRSLSLFWRLSVDINGIWVHRYRIYCR